MSLRCDVIKPLNGTGPFDLNVTENEYVYDVSGYAVGSVQAYGPVGGSSWGTAVLTIRRSNDGKNPVALETATTFSASGMTNSIDFTSFKFLHVCLTTNEGAAGFCELTVIGKVSE